MLTRAHGDLGPQCQRGGVATRPHGVGHTGEVGLRTWRQPPLEVPSKLLRSKQPRGRKAAEGVGMEEEDRTKGRLGRER
jgi:hypothetical protein